MSLYLICILAAASAAWLAATSGWNALMIVPGFLVCFGVWGLAFFSVRGGKLLRCLWAASHIIALASGLTVKSVWTYFWVLLAANVALILLSIVFLVVVCAMVDLEQPQNDEDSPFYRKVMYLYIEELMAFALVRLTASGLEKTPKDTRFLLVSNHLEIPDPGILHHCFRNSQLAFITKYENMTMPIINKFMHKTLCQPLVREDDRQGLRVILKCIQLIKEDKASIAVFPEGYTTVDGRLRHFRPGVFKIAQKANVPIVVCTLRGCEHIIPNLKKLKPTPVEVRLLDVLPAESLKGRTTADISSQVYEMMIADLGEDHRAIDTENT